MFDTHPTLIVLYTSFRIKTYFQTSRPTRDFPFFILHNL